MHYTAILQVTIHCHVYLHGGALRQTERRADVVLEVLTNNK